MQLPLGLTLLVCLVATSMSQDVKPENTEEINNDFIKQCSCVAAECQCCVDFNITYIDLGGPGCVKMKYLSENEGISLNISYGDSQLHGGHIQGYNATSTCMDILLYLAQMCASFSEISKTENGLTACVSLEPHLLGDPQDSYELGCFDMSPSRMVFLNATNISSGSPEETGESLVSSERPGNEEDLIAVVNESAKQGIAWFSTFLGFNYRKNPKNESLAERNAEVQKLIRVAGKEALEPSDLSVSNCRIDNTGPFHLASAKQLKSQLRKD